MFRGIDTFITHVYIQAIIGPILVTKLSSNYILALDEGA